MILYKIGKMWYIFVLQVHRNFLPCHVLLSSDEKTGLTIQLFFFLTLQGKETNFHGNNM